MTLLRTEDASHLWLDGQLRVFITHISAYKSAAAKFRSSLQPFHISGFVAHSDIQPMREWEEEILLALRSADAIVALLHKGFHESYWTDQEIGIGIGRGIITVSITFGETPYGFIGRYQAVQGRGKSYDKLAEEVFRIFAIHPQTRRRMAEALVHKLSISGEYKEAIDTVRLIEDVEYWDNSLTKRAKETLRQNRQVSDAYTVPERLNRHIKHWDRSYDIPF